MEFYSGESGQPGHFSEGVCLRRVHSAGSLIITSKVSIDRWHDIVGNPTLADAILDRIIPTRMASNVRA